MVEKTLSSGTLNLRFMQNARRAQQPDPEQAHVKDDAEWEVSPEIRQSAYHTEKAVTYETSYLPFLFPSLHDTPTADSPSSLSPSNTLRPRGRRVFNKHGQEVTQEPRLSASSSAADAAPENTDRETNKTRPHSISATARQSKKANKDAKNLIFNMTGVGTDLRHAPFLRPSGVDEPASPANTASQSSTGATQPPGPRVKRSRTAGDADRPKKKTKRTPME